MSVTYFYLDLSNICILFRNHGSMISNKILVLNFKILPNSSSLPLHYEMGFLNCFQGYTEGVIVQ
jgi:hypothetical protein